MSTLLDPNNERFLRDCLRTLWQPEAWRAVEEAARAGAVDWPTLCDHAAVDGLAPMLHDRLQGRDLAPPAITARLDDLYHQAAVVQAVFLAELGRTLAGLSRAGLPVILLKGAALAGHVYPNAALRPMTDVDLLVRPKDAPAALEQLECLGYRRTEVEPHRGLSLAFENEVRLVRPEMPALAMELHWHLLDAPYYQRRLDANWFWETARPIPIDGQEALSLGPEANFLYLAAHYVLHHWGQGLRWPLDIALLLLQAGPTLDWDLVCARAVALELVLPLQAVLPALAGQWGVPIPPDILARVLALPVSPAERRVAGSLRTPNRPVARRFLDDLAGLGGWRRRIAYALAQLFPSPAYMQDRYALPHPALTPLAYPYRWLLGLRDLLRGGGALRRRTGER